MDFDLANEIKTRALNAIKDLHGILKLPGFDETPEREALHKAVGLTIGTIDYDLLGIVRKQYPELDDLTEAQRSGK